MQGECSLILILVQPRVTSVSRSHVPVHSGCSQFCSPSLKYQILSINIHIMYFIKFFYKKFGYNTCCCWLKSLLYQSTFIKHSAGLKLLHHLPICMFDLFPNFSPALFGQLKVKFQNKQAGKQQQKKWGESLDYVLCFFLHFFHALTATCMLYNRTEHSQGLSISQKKNLSSVQNNVKGKVQTQAKQSIQPDLSRGITLGYRERHCKGNECFAQEHNTLNQPGLEPRPLNLESSSLTIRPPCLPLIN